MYMCSPVTFQKVPPVRYTNAAIYRNIDSAAESGQQSSCDDAAAAVAEANGGQCRSDDDHSPEALPSSANCSVIISQASAGKLQPSSPEDEKEAVCGHQRAAATSDDCDEKMASSTITDSGASDSNLRSVVMATESFKTMSNQRPIQADS